MVAATPLFSTAVREVVAVPDDGRVTLDGLTWDQYVAISDALPDHAGVRMTYLEGTLEIMTTGARHEVLKKTLARLIEAHADEMRVDLTGYGNATFRKQAEERGLEPDECYSRHRLAEGDMPELAIEVVVSHGDIDKLAVYAGLGVGEVWFWEAGVISVFCLGPDGYRPSTRSRLLPDLDVAELASFVSSENQPQAVRAYRALQRERALSRC
jgi:Uma2 family endonuclease